MKLPSPNSSILYLTVLPVVLCYSLSFAQTDNNEGTSYWNPNQFSEVIFPSEFGIAENLIWGSKLVFSHPDLKEIIPGYAFKSEDLCELENRPSDVPGLLIIDGDANNVYAPTGQNSVDNFCDHYGDSTDGANNLSTQNFINSTRIEDSSRLIERILQTEEILHTEEILKTTNSESPLSITWILTHTAISDIDPVVAFWWKCNNNLNANAIIPNSICHEVLSHSPFTIHRRLVQSN